ncbi:MAG: creatininase family protein [Bacteroidales bacterium]
MKPYILSHTNYKALRKEKFQVALLPWGATEAHNFHLPYGTDNFETAAIAAKSAGLAWENGTRCLVLPHIPFGVNTGQHDIPGTINLYPSTQSIILHDVLESVLNSGIHKILILNGHGGNDFKQMLREAGRGFPEMFLATANWFQSVDKTILFKNQGDHADEMETSLMLHLEPSLVLPLDQAGPGNSRTFDSQALNESWAWSERQWSKVTDDTGIGNPKEATAEKGEAYFKAVCSKVAQLIIEIGKLENDNPYGK